MLRFAPVWVEVYHFYYIQSYKDTGKGNAASHVKKRTPSKCFVESWAHRLTLIGPCPGITFYMNFYTENIRVREKMRKYEKMSINCCKLMEGSDMLAHYTWLSWIPTLDDPWIPWMAACHGLLSEGLKTLFQCVGSLTNVLRLGNIDDLLGESSFVSNALIASSLRFQHVHAVSCERAALAQANARSQYIQLPSTAYVWKDVLV